MTKSLQAYRLLRLLCGPTRFKIILLLREAPRGLTVTELARLLGVTLTRVSHQLAILRRYGLVTGRGRNREVVYRLADHRLRKVLATLLD